MGVDIDKIRAEIAGVAEVHGVELVALEWLQGPGRGVLRLYIDRPGGHPAVVDPDRLVTADRCVAVSRDVGAILDADESLIPMAYDLEVSSPGFERPVQKRDDFERFAGLEINVKLRERVESRASFTGVLRGTVDLPGGGFAVKVEAAGRVWELPFAKVTRARLSEIKAPKPGRPGKGPSKRTKTEQRPGDAPRSDATEGDGKGPSPAR